MLALMPRKSQAAGMKLYILPSAAVIATSAAILFSSTSSDLSAQEAAAAEAPKGQQWEYRALRIPDNRPTGGRQSDIRARKSGSEEVLNQLGAEGWELVAVRATGANTDPVFYFKRPKK